MPSVTVSFPIRTAGGVTALAVLLVACSDDSDPTDPGEPSPPAPAPEGLDCTEFDYPCTASQVERGVVEETMALQEQAVEQYSNGRSMEEIRGDLASEEGVVEVGGEGDVLWFRLDGGRHGWVLGEGARPFASDDASAGATGMAPGSDRASTGAGATATGDVVRRSPDDATPKHALVVAPFAWEFDDTLDGQWVADHLRSVRGYREKDGGSVTHLQDSAAGVSAFEGWSEYDVIHVETHGNVFCGLDEGRCLSILATGREVESVDDYLDSDEETDLVRFATGEVEGRTFLVVTRDFFASRYEGGLERSFIFVNGCKSASAEADAGGERELGPLLAGESSTYVGWSNYIQDQHAQDLQEFLYPYLTGHGVTTGRAYEALEEEERASVDHERGGADVVMVRPSDVRLREIVQVNNLFRGGKMRDGDATPLEGVPGDGEHDALPVQLELDGVHPGEETGYQVSLDVDGQAIDVGTPADEAWDQVDDYSYRLDDTVSLGFDVEPEGTLDLRAETSLHESSGESHHQVAAVVGNLATNFDSRIEIRYEGQLVELSQVVSDLPLADAGDGTAFHGEASVEHAEFWSVIWSDACQLDLVDGRLELEVILPEGEPGAPAYSSDMEAVLGVVDGEEQPYVEVHCPDAEPDWHWVWWPYFHIHHEDNVVVAGQSVELTGWQESSRNGVLAELSFERSRMVYPEDGGDPVESTEITSVEILHGGAN